MPVSKARRMADAARADLRTTLASDLTLFDRVHDAVESLMTSGVLYVQFPRGVNAPTLDLALGLVAKSYKTMRAVRATCLEGCGEDAMILLRSQFESMLAVLYILQRDTRRRSMLYVAHGHYRRLVQLREITRTRGQKRAISKASIRQQQDLVQAYESELGADAVKAVRSHWGGQGGLESVAKRVGRGYWRRLYNSLYRTSSMHGHAGDAVQHYRYRTREDGVTVPVLSILPSEAAVRECLLAAASLSLSLVHRVDERFAIGRAAEWDKLAGQVNARYAAIRAAGGTHTSGAAG